METADSKNQSAHCQSSMVLSSVLKVEIALAVVWFFQSSMEIALALAAACVLINQLTETFYFRKENQAQKNLVLLTSVAITVCFYLVAYTFQTDFIYRRNGEIRFDMDKIWLVAKLLAFIFMFLGVARFLAVGGDRLIDWCGRRKKSMRFGRQLKTNKATTT